MRIKSSALFSRLDFNQEPNMMNVTTQGGWYNNEMYPYLLKLFS
jgi:hypothetical protein